MEAPKAPPGQATGAVSAPEGGDVATPGAGPSRESEGKASEETSSKALRAPIRPTQQMIDDHCVSHLPFRSWCPACVRGRAKSVPHVEVQKGDEQIPTISCDYGFFGAEGELVGTEIGSSTLPILVIKDRRPPGSGAIASHPVPQKGVHVHATSAMLADLDAFGYKRVILKSDQENALKALCREVKNGWSGEIVPENSPKGESRSNGEVERAVQEVQGLTRTVKDDFEQRTGMKLRPKDPLVAWLVEYVGVLFTLFHRGEDGLTAHHHLRGKPWRVPLPLWGELVEFALRTKNKFQQRWQPGLYVGLRLSLIHISEPTRPY